MKTAPGILLFLIVITTGTQSGAGIHFIFKVASFAHHFAHHILCHQENIDLTDFVYLHYFNPEHHEQDHQEHQNLPFQHHHSHSGVFSHNIFYFLPPLAFVFQYAQPEDEGNALVIPPPNRHSPPHICNVWEPPKPCC